MSDNKQMDRKGFLGTITWAIGGLISLGLGIPGVAYLIGPALQEKDQAQWIRLGSSSKVELGKPTLFKTTIRRQTGWIVNEEERAAYVLTEDGREYSALSNICTHLGCKVRWIDDDGHFFCPCHNAVFSKEGEVLAGPPPEPLEAITVKVEDDQIYIKGE